MLDYVGAKVDGIVCDGAAINIMLWSEFGVK